jgi:hypothetical protein
MMLDYSVSPSAVSDTMHSPSCTLIRTRAQPRRSQERSCVLSHSTRDTRSRQCRTHTRPMRRRTHAYIRCRHMCDANHTWGTRGSFEPARARTFCHRFPAAHRMMSTPRTHPHCKCRVNMVCHWPVSNRQVHLVGPRLARSHTRPLHFCNTRGTRRSCPGRICTRPLRHRRRVRIGRQRTDCARHTGYRHFRQSYTVLSAGALRAHHMYLGDVSNTEVQKYRRWCTRQMYNCTGCPLVVVSRRCANRTRRHIRCLHCDSTHDIRIAWSVRTHTVGRLCHTSADTRPTCTYNIQVVSGVDLPLHQAARFSRI